MPCCMGTPSCNVQWLTNLFRSGWTTSTDAGDKQPEECSDLQEEKLPTAKGCHWVGADTVPKMGCRLSDNLECLFLLLLLLLFVVCRWFLVVGSLFSLLLLVAYFWKQFGGHRWSYSSPSSTVNEALGESSCCVVQRRTVSPSILRNLANHWVCDESPFHHFKMDCSICLNDDASGTLDHKP